MQPAKRVLILGKGGFGAELAELLVQSGRYEETLFLDDNAPGCAGKLADLTRPELLAACPDAFAAVGDNAFRLQLLRQLEEAGYQLPVFVHPDASVSPTAQLGPGTVVLPQCYVGARVRAGRGCILNAGAVVDHDAVLGQAVHAAPGAIVKAGARVDDCIKVDSGRVVPSPWDAAPKPEPASPQQAANTKGEDMPQQAPQPTRSAKPSAPPAGRRVYIDAMKGLGIILVVWGHFEEYCRGTDPLFNATFECMYLFHMALFCLCSGLVAKFNWKKLIFQQVWLYLLCQALLMVFRADVLHEDLAAAGSTWTVLLTPWRHMWYLYALIFWELTVPLLAFARDKLALLRGRLGWPGIAIGTAGRLALFAAAVAIGLQAGKVDWPYTLNRVFCFFPFYAAGVLFREEVDRWYRASQRFAVLRLTPGFLFAAVYGVWLLRILRAPEPVYEGARIFNDVAYTDGYTMTDRGLFYLIGLLSALALIAALGNIRPLASLGKRTLPIYIVHMPVYAFLVELGVYAVANEKGMPAMAGWVFLAAGGTVCLFGAVPIAALFDFVASLWYKWMPAAFRIARDEWLKRYGWQDDPVPAVGVSGRRIDSRRPAAPQEPPEQPGPRG